MSKYFITFPFPYVNGRLHLGHVYTILKAEFRARYEMARGQKVLFPFAFHGTGMPIVSCAEKLAETLDKYGPEPNLDLIENSNQYKILANMDIPFDLIPNFTDPYYWLKYFPEVTKSELKQLGTCIDFERSFITTDLNPHFDSFVRWQMSKLQKQGMLVFGTKPIMFSIKDNQPCAGHDRSVGENVKILTHKLNFKLINSHKFMISASPDTEFILVNPNHDYPIFKIAGEQVIGFKPDMIRAMPYQQPGVELMSTIAGHKLIDHQSVRSADVDYIQGTWSEEPTFEMLYYEPDGVVISRSQDPCIVAVIDQWYIDYNKFKGPIETYISTFDVEPQIREILSQTNQWLDLWPCTRSKGLGTKFQETELLIDSLSDSTVYMAYYTIAHLIGEIPVARLTEKVWDEIFGLSDYPTDEIILKCRREFECWYPVDMRVSGKDLLNNHLVMSLHHHYAIWQDKYLPRSYAINGHVLRNGRKMAKSEGNFLTLKSALDRYSAQGIRFTLAQCGRGFDDANFIDSNVAENELHLKKELSWIESYQPTESTDETFWEARFDHEINCAIHETQKCYEAMDFQKVIFTAFHSLLRAKKTYLKHGSHPRLLRKYATTLVQLIRPIVPDYAPKIALGWPECYPIDEEMNYKIFLLDQITARINKLLSKNRKGPVNIKVTVYEQFPDQNQLRQYPDIPNKQLLAQVKLGLQLWKGWLQEYLTDCSHYEYKLYHQHLHAMYINYNLILEVKQSHTKYSPMNPNVSLELV